MRPAHSPGHQTTVLALAAIATVCVIAPGRPHLWSTVGLVAFILVAPGAALDVHLVCREVVVRLVVIGATGLATTALCSELLAVTGLWSPVRTVVLVAAVCVATAYWPIRTSRRGVA